VAKKIPSLCVFVVKNINLRKSGKSVVPTSYLTSGKSGLKFHIVLERKTGIMLCSVFAEKEQVESSDFFKGEPNEA